MVTQNTSSVFQVDFPVSPLWFRAIRGLITSAAVQSGFDERIAGQVAMATDEALCNVFQHGYKGDNTQRVKMEVHAYNDPTPFIEIQIEDDAPYVDISAISPRNLEEVRPGGLGLHLIHSIMDTVEWNKLETGGTRLNMTKKCQDIMITPIHNGKQHS